jgi:hypothetical protein
VEQMFISACQKSNITTVKCLEVQKHSNEYQLK